MEDKRVGRSQEIVCPFSPPGHNCRALPEMDRLERRKKKAPAYRAIPCGRLHHCEIPSERCRLLINQRHLHQFYVDCQTQPPVELIKQCGFPAGEYFAELRHVFQSQLHN